MSGKVSAGSFPFHGEDAARKIPRSGAYCLFCLYIHDSHRCPQWYPAPQSAAKRCHRREGPSHRRIWSHIHSRFPSVPELYSHCPSKMDPPYCRFSKDPCIRFRVPVPAASRPTPRYAFPSFHEDSVLSFCCFPLFRLLILHCRQAEDDYIPDVLQTSPQHKNMLEALFFRSHPDTVPLPA